MKKRESLKEFVGCSAVVQKEIEKQDTAVLYGTKDLPEFLATPAYVALMIQAATEAIADKILDGETTVGRAMSFIHEQPTMIGMMVSMKATVEKVDDRILYFKVEAYDEIGSIGHGTHERQLVNRDSLKRKAKERIQMIDWKGK